MGIVFVTDPLSFFTVWLANRNEVFRFPQKYTFTTFPALWFTHLPSTHDRRPRFC